MKIIENNILIKGDCFEVIKKMPDKSVDLILTDVPYLLDNHGGGNTDLAQRKLVKEKHIDFMSSGIDYNVIFPEFVRICKKPNMLIFCSNDQVPFFMKWFIDNKLKTTLLVWEKTNPSPLCNGKYLSDLEFVVYVHTNGSTFNNNCPFAYKRKLYTSPIVNNKNRLHPAQKNIKQLEQYIQLHSNNDDTIFDPYVGSGSTCIACINTNRNYIGIERDEYYYNIACQRISDLKKEKESFLFEL